MRVIVLGKNGMLGSYVYKYLDKKYDVIGTTRKQIDAYSFKKKLLNPPNFREGDVVINCIGLIKQRADITKAEYIAVNALFPNVVADYCENNGLKFIQISTDCVFDGKEGAYDETSTHNAVDLYGISKSLGEPENATVVRTSIIGEEIKNKLSLLEWVKSNEGKEINGFTNHYWNGITCLQFAKICDMIIEKNLFWRGVRHIYSPNKVSKYELVNLIAEIFNINVKVNRFEDASPCDRTLSSIYAPIIRIPELRGQLEELYQFSTILKSKALSS